MPTLKQKKAVEILSENIGKPIGEAMLEAGYAESTSLTPQLLTESKGWQELVEDKLPDSELLRVHREGLEATKSDKLILKIGGEEEMKLIETPDYATRHKYLETAYKIKNKTKEEVTHKFDFTDIIKQKQLP